jgi:Family of unknown function (DUF5694)
MKYPITLLLILTSVFASAQQKTKVLIVGSYHMGNPGLDKYNMESDDVTAPKRQKEIEDFVNLLIKFKPTKICLESKKPKDLNDVYASYRDGKSELRKNEIDQVGFRLAKKTGLKEVYAIDAPAPFDMDTVVNFAQKNNFEEFMKDLGKMPEFMASEDKLLKESTVTQYYQHLNSTAYNLWSHQFYLKMAAIGKGDNYVGADLVADWYKRNLRIYRNIEQLPITKEDRILILYGAGHSKILQDLVRDSHNLELVELSQLK